MRLFLCLFFVFFGVLPEVQAQEVSAQPPIKKESSRTSDTRKLMGEFLNELIFLKKFFVSEEKFVDPKNSKEIEAHLRKFSDLAKTASHDRTLGQENFKFSRLVLQQQIVEVERAFRLGNKSYARWQLGTTVGVCMNCHTQMPTRSARFGEFGNTQLFSSDFDRAEFLFTIKAFDQALPIYQKLLQSSATPAAQKETALQRELVYYVRVKESPEQALSLLRTQGQDKSLPEYLKKNIAAWMTELAALSKEKKLDPKKTSGKEISAYAQKHLQKWNKEMDQASEPKLINDLRVSGVLYQYLQSHPSSQETPEVLYWLALSERPLSHQFFYSLSDLFLLECMIKYPQAAVAEKCYQEYETQTVSGYTGSSGTHLPKEVREELNRLKKWVQSKGSVPVFER
jgi:hypothetical protein